MKAFMLHLLAKVFGLVVLVRNSLFDAGWFTSTRLPGRVVSIGNIAVGGTGKSPVVIMVAAMIQKTGGFPVVLTRGYRSGLGRNEWQVIRNGQVVAGTARANIVADEAMMQSRKLPNVPIVVGRNRKMAAGRYLQSNSQERVTHWILDDGFQHRQIARDTDIVLLDARSPAGRLLPAGRFREPASSLKRASMIIITKAETSAQKRAAIEFARSFNPSIPIAEVGFRPQKPECVAGVPTGVPLKWALVAGIANPQDFVAFAKMHGVSPSQTLFVPDHYPFLPRDLNELTKFCDGILTTEKDFSRAETLFRQLTCPVYVLPLTADWEGSAPSF